MAKGDNEMVDLIESNVSAIKETQKNKYLTFSVDSENYGLNIKYVTEIIGIQMITAIPNQHLCIKGVINLRGKIIPTLDMRLRFCKQEMAYDDRTCIIVLDINGMDLGIIVDRVLEVMNISESQISDPPKFVGSNQNKFINGIGKIEDFVVLLLDSNALITGDQLNGIATLESELN